MSLPFSATSVYGARLPTPRVPTNKHYCLLTGARTPNGKPEPSQLHAVKYLKGNATRFASSVCLTLVYRRVAWTHAHCANMGILLVLRGSPRVSSNTRSCLNTSHRDCLEYNEHHYSLPVHHKKNREFKLHLPCWNLHSTTKIYSRIFWKRRHKKVHLPSKPHEEIQREKHVWFRNV